MTIESKSAILRPDLFPGSNDEPAPATAPPPSPEPEPVRPPVSNSAISVVLPIHNQAANLEAVLAGWIDALEAMGRDYEILLIDDGSTDDTAGRAEDLAKRHARVRSFRHTVHRGFGASLRSGLRYAQHPLFFYTTGNLHYQPRDLQRFFLWIDRVDLVAGYRIERTRRYRERMRERWLRWVVRWLFAVRLKDPGCIYVLARKAVMDRIPVQSDGWFAHAEIIAKANFLGYMMAEAPVGYDRLVANFESSSDGIGECRYSEMYELFKRPQFAPDNAAFTVADAADGSPPVPNPP